MTTPLKQAAQKALEAREESFQRWFMLQSKMPYRNPQEIAGMAWHAAMEHVHVLLGAAFVPQPTDAGAQACGAVSEEPPTGWLIYTHQRIDPYYWHGAVFSGNEWNSYPIKRKAAVYDRTRDTVGGAK